MLQPSKFEVWGNLLKYIWRCYFFSPIYVTFEIDASSDPDFIGAYLTRWDFINRALKYQQGTVYERMAVSPEDFVSIKCCFPQKAEQTRLAEFITLLDNRIAAQGKYVESLKKYKRGVFEAVFSQKLRLVPTELQKTLEAIQAIRLCYKSYPKKWQSNGYSSNHFSPIWTYRPKGLFFQKW